MTRFASQDFVVAAGICLGRQCQHSLFLRRFHTVSILTPLLGPHSVYSHHGLQLSSPPDSRPLDGGKLGTLVG